MVHKKEVHTTVHQTAGIKTLHTRSDKKVHCESVCQGRAMNQGKREHGPRIFDFGALEADTMHSSPILVNST